MRARRLPTFLSLIAIAGCANHADAPPVASPPTAAKAEQPNPADAAMRGAYSAALQGDGLAAVAVLKPIDPAPLSEKARALRACMLDRLEARHLPATTIDDRFLSDLLSAYREYWLRSLRAEHPLAENEASLLAALNALASANGGKAEASMDALEPWLEAQVTARGQHALFGMTSPLHEFMLWKTQTSQTYTVQLPQAVQPVTVVFMDEFASLGWAGFATCDRVHSGGWTKPDALYAVRSAYDLDSENFRVSYLAHEAEHFWDNARFPDLEQPELEYRAKLVELATGKDGLYVLLDNFAGNVGDDRSVPHSHANGRVVRELRAQLFGGDAAKPWTQASAQRINEVAKKLLDDDTQRLAKIQLSSKSDEAAGARKP
jgi:hypothetical protein